MITAEEAFLVLDKLQTGRSTILCFGRLFGWNVFFLGRVDRVSREELKIVSRDGTASLLLSLDLDDLAFEYAELRNVPDLDVPEEAKESAGLIIALPLRVSPSDVTGPLRIPKRETLTVLERIEEDL